jgi:glycosyltransferase involved in cell wall biosynthesis
MDNIWITWESHRRTLELANALDVKLYVIEYRNSGIIRYIKSSYRTIIIIIENKPKFLFIQNPSMILNTLVCFMKSFYKYNLIVDRHTNFLLEKNIYISPLSMLYELCSRYCIKNSDLIIVTNEFLKNIVDQRGGTGIILTDRLPTLNKMNNVKLIGKLNIVFISTFADDEPFLEVFKAAKLIDSNIYIYVTGNYNKIKNNLFDGLPENVILTGYLKEQDFIDLLYSSDAIMDFTTAEWTLVCGGYESISVGKPFLTSNKIALRSYFKKGTLFTENNANDIAESINKLIEYKSKYTTEIEILKKEKKHEWEQQYQCLLTIIKKMK